MTAAKSVSRCWRYIESSHGGVGFISIYPALFASDQGCSGFYKFQNFKTECILSIFVPRFLQSAGMMPASFQCTEMVALPSSEPACRANIATVRRYVSDTIDAGRVGSISCKMGHSHFGCSHHLGGQERGRPWQASLVPHYMADGRGVQH